MVSLPSLFLLASLQYHLPPRLLESICWVESKHKIHAFHKDDGRYNSIGVCQIQVPAAQLVGFTGTEKDLQNPETNITYAAAYLAHQLKRYNNDYLKAVIAYNRGSAKSLTHTAYSDKVFMELRLRAEHKNIEIGDNNER